MDANNEAGSKQQYQEVGKSDNNVDNSLLVTPSNKRRIRSPLKKRRRRRHTRKYINMRLNIFGSFAVSNFNKMDGAFYFGCIAHLNDGKINVHCNKLSDIGELGYCCAILLKIDRSFTVRTILSTEFMSALKSITLQKMQSVEKNDENDDEKKYDVHDAEMNAKTITAFHPRDHWLFAKDIANKHVILYIHGQNYATANETAAEFIMNECIAFYCGLPYLVIPFIWPSEGTLFDYDTELSENYCANEFVIFMKRIWSLFERIDFVAHGKGCNILLQALELCMSMDRNDIIQHSSVICIAPDIPVSIFNQHLFNIQRNVRSINVYVNTWDWKLFSSKWWNWTENRAGAMLNVQHDGHICSSSKAKIVDMENGNQVFENSNVFIIDTTKLLSTWFGSNHYYLTNEFVKKDIIQLLSVVGGLMPEHRYFVLPVNKEDGDYVGNVYELVDKPYDKQFSSVGNGSGLRSEIALEVKENDENGAFVVIDMHGKVEEEEVLDDSKEEEEVSVVNASPKFSNIISDLKQDLQNV